MATTAPVLETHLERESERGEISGVFPRALATDRDALSVAAWLQKLDHHADRRGVYQLTHTLVTYLERKLAKDDFPEQLVAAAPDRIAAARVLARQLEELTASGRDLLGDLSGASPVEASADRLHDLIDAVRRYLADEESLWLDSHYLDLGIAG